MTLARLAAVRALTAIERGGTTLAAEMERARLVVGGSRDRGLLLEIVAGVLRWRNELDFLIASASSRGVPSLDSDVRAVLRLGAYQLRHLQRVPPHAVLHESVEITRRLGHGRAAGFVNAVLRALTRRRHDSALLPPRPADAGDRATALRYLTITLSHPEWLAARWLDRFGFESARRWCEFNNAPPELTLRSLAGQSAADLRDAIGQSGIEPQSARFLSEAVRLPAGALGRLPPDLRASVMVQEEASQIVAHAVGAGSAGRVLDACAAPGGKTMVLGSDMGGSGLLVSADRRAGRVALLRSTLRQSNTRAAVVTLDATRPFPFGAVFDRVLVDAPCSGLGTLRRDPDLKWSRTPEDLPRLAAVQAHMAEHAAAAVAPGGSLVYATCSSEPEENERVVERFLAAHGDFVLEPPRLAPHVRDAGRLVDSRGYLRTLPFEHGLDAFFAAVLTRRGSARPGSGV
jgi:16S rRNA (cytosine967-C5)-methyltransferase